MAPVTPSGIDPYTPSAARMYDYYLGGTTNTAADRAAAEPILEMIPELPDVLKGNRRFLVTAARYLAEQGIRQFIDIGTGIPTPPNVHETVQTVIPDARVVYVDNDPQVTAINEAVRRQHRYVVPVRADIRRPETILEHPEVRRSIDFHEPVALLLVAIFHFITDADDPQRIIRTLTTPLVNGSYLALSSAISDRADADTMHRISDIYTNATAPFIWRTRAQVKAFFGGWPLVAPGLVRPVDWSPEREPRSIAHVDGADSVDWFCAGVARKPAS